MRTRKTVIILVSGNAGSGKSTSAEILEKLLKNFEDITVFRYAFASPLKFIAKAYMGWDGNKDEKGRKLLQDLGKIGREYDIDIWVKHLLGQLNKNSPMLPFNFVIVDDWRFSNELETLRRNSLFDVITIRLFGRADELPGNTASDVSEHSLPSVNTETLELSSWRTETEVYYDFQINNSTDLPELSNKLELVLAQVKDKFILD